MIKVIFINQDGVETEVLAPEGLSLLEAAHMHKIPLEGACEGSLACSTCHVIVDSNFYNLLPKASDDEEDMLDLAFGLSHTSRLGCQIILNPTINGIKVRLPNATRNLMVK